VAQNQVYKRGGNKISEHDQEDLNFNFQGEGGDVFLYGVFDGHCGSRAAKFVCRTIPNHILLGQLTDTSTEDQIREVLRQAYLSVEREYFSEYIGQKLAQRASLISELPDGPYPSQLLEQLNREVGSGTTAVVVLIFNGKLYVSNVGNSRALLCRTDKEGVLRVTHLSVDHDLKNPDELRRLQELGLDTSCLQRVGLGKQPNTRCIGNYFVKGGYKELESLSGAKNEPVLAEPEIHPAVKVDESIRFLILLSDGIYQALREISDSEPVDIKLARMIVEEFRTQSTYHNVAQAVVDKVCRMHHDCFMSAVSPKLNRRDDMTLLIRNFNTPLTNSNSYKGSSQTPLWSDSSFGSNGRGTPVNTFEQSPSPMFIQTSDFDRTSFTNDTTTDTPSSTETGSSSDRHTQSNHKLPLDENGRIRPYVNFADFNLNLASKGWTDDNIFS